MKNNDVLNLTMPTNTGRSVFRAVIGNVKDLPLSLAIIENDKRLKAKGESIRDVLKEKEPNELEKLRKENDPSFQKKYTEFTLRPEIQEFLKTESDIEFKQRQLDVKYVKNAGFETDAVELLMLFTNIEEVIEKIAEEKEAEGKTKKTKNNIP